MTENTIYFLECETKDKDFGMTTFSARLDHLIRDFADWLRSNEIALTDIVQPKIYRTSDLACVATLNLEDGQVILQPCRAYTGPFAKLINKIRFDLRYLPRRFRYVLDVQRVRDTDAPPVDDDPDDPDDTDDLDIF
ncbi:MAG: hypothetical protein IKW92_05420 [Firmicutes bacterium]|nr:hypothetical protein [Bacillota bacterium]